MRPFFYRQGLFAYPIYGLVGASFGYWLQGMEDNQMRYLGETRDRLIEKRRRRAEREGGRLDRKSTRLNSSHSGESRMPSSA